MKLCRDINCPHPSRLGETPWNIDEDQFNDWYGLYLWEVSDDKPTETERMEFLANYKQVFGFS